MEKSIDVSTCFLIEFSTYQQFEIVALGKGLYPANIFFGTQYFMGKI
jgi:hypothetical protein